MCVGRRRRPCRFVCRTRATRVIQRGMRRSRSLPPRGSCRTKRRAFVADFRTDQPRAARAGPATSQRQLEPLSPLLKGFEKTVFIIRGACRQHRALVSAPLLPLAMPLRGSRIYGVSGQRASGDYGRDWTAPAGQRAERSRSQPIRLQQQPARRQALDWSASTTIICTRFTEMTAPHKTQDTSSTPTSTRGLFINTSPPSSSSSSPYTSA
jgi:hypothetical protein